MKKRTVLFSVFCLVFMFRMASASEDLIWEQKSYGLHDSKVQHVYLPSFLNTIYAATPTTLYKSFKKPLNFKQIFYSSRRDNRINSIYISPQNDQYIYIATDDGVFFSDDSGLNWRRIFHSINKLENECNTLIEHKGKVYVGTGKGLFIKDVFGNQWMPLDHFRHKAIFILCEAENIVFIATDKELYGIYDEDSRVQELFRFNRLSKKTEDIYSEDSVYTNNFIKDIYVDKTSPSNIYLASSLGLHISSNKGKDWKKIDSGNVPIETITNVIKLSGNSYGHGIEDKSKPELKGLLVGTLKGAFLWEQGTWRHLYKGMESNKVYDLAQDDNGLVYAATERGLFYLKVRQAVSSGKETVQSNIDYKFNNEPGIKQVHAWAIDFADVDIEKIRRWRKLIKRKAWLPKVNIGADGKKNRTTSDSVWGSYSGGGQEHIGPDDKTFYDNFGWDMSLSWDLGDLVWSSDQTSVDSRSKLMVELREDVLEQVTRLYFERRRLLVELYNESLMDGQIEIEKRLRAQELTALLDSMTGGQFSQHIKKEETGHGAEH